ncbi:MAG: hypothetical protein ACLQME_06605, partial [Alphaproteobacteria bacterium]
CPHAHSRHNNKHVQLDQFRRSERPRLQLRNRSAWSQRWGPLQGSGSDARRLCFRGLFIDGDDVKIGKIVEEYFKAVQARWPQAWAYRDPGLMLNRTNGFRALMRIFGKIYMNLGGPGDLVNAARFLELFRRVNVDWDYFTVERFKPGTSGEADLRHFLEQAIFGQALKK